MREIGDLNGHAGKLTREVGGPLLRAGDGDHLVTAVEQPAGQDRTDPGPGSGEQVDHRGPRGDVSEASVVVG